MSLIEWDETLETGFLPLDDEHRKLVSLVNELYEYLIAGSSVNLIGAAFKQLARHTVEHFRREEKLMEDSRFPDTHSHRVQHLELEKQITELMSGLDAGAPLFTRGLVDFLKDWLVNHIQTMDRTFGEYLTQQAK